MPAFLIRALLFALFVAAILLAIFHLADVAFARNADGRYDKSPNKDFYNSLSSPRHGACCSGSDGLRLEDPDWTEGTEINGQKCILAPDDERNTDHKGSYCVKLDGLWYLVPNQALVEQPNTIGIAEVWPTYVEQRNMMGGLVSRTLTMIRCFMPGARASLQPQRKSRTS